MTPPNPDPVYTVVAEMFDEFASDLEKAATRIRRNAEMLRAAETDPDEIVPRSLKVVPDDKGWIPL